MLDKTNLQPNYAEVAAQILDNEVIIIRLGDGIYYSMEGVGVLVWQLIESNNSVDNIIHAVTRYYETDTDRVSKDINNLIESLLSERLVTIYEGTLTKASQNEPTVDHNLDTASYETPTLNVYEDMNDLLALDPPAPGRQGFNSPIN